MNDNDKSIEVMQNLVETCQDGKRGYQDASEHIENAELKTILYRLSQQRALFEAELKDEIRKLGGDPEDIGTVKGTMHRVWINIKSGIKKNDTEALLNECKRGDSAAVKIYEKALKEDLPHFILDIVEEQFKLIKGTYTQLTEFQKNPNS